MFTGIIKGRGSIELVDVLPGLCRLSVALPEGAQDSLEIGASVAIDGVCLTVSQHQGRIASFDVMQESLTRTTLGELKIGDVVNVERAARDGAEVGGHLLSGHIDCTVSVAKIATPENNCVFTFEVPAEYMRYIFSKGYVALNGTSLTITAVNKQACTFEVWFIPETLRQTTFGAKRKGDRINLEVERGTQVTVDTVNAYMDERFGKLLPALEALLTKAGIDLSGA